MAVAQPSSNPDSSTSAKPLYGWESFRYKIDYPQYGTIKGISGVVFAYLRIDVNGAIDSVSIWGADDDKSGDHTGREFIKPVRKVIAKSLWTPATSNGTPYESSIVISIYFRFKGTNPEPITIEASPPPHPIH